MERKGEREYFDNWLYRIWAIAVILTLIGSSLLILYSDSLITLLI